MKKKDLGLGPNIDMEVVPVMSEDDVDVLMDSSDVPEELPVLTLRAGVLLPGAVLPIHAGREHSINLFNKCRSKHPLIAVVAQVDDTEVPYQDDLFVYGTVARVIKVMDLPNGVVLGLVQGVCRVKLESLNTVGPFYTGRVSKAIERDFDTFMSEPGVKNRIRVLRKTHDSLNKLKGRDRNPVADYKSITSSRVLINFMATHGDFEVLDKEMMLECDTYDERLEMIQRLLNEEMAFYEVQKEIQEKTQRNMDQQQREYMLHQQMRTIQDELGGSPAEEEANQLREAASKKLWSQEMADLFDRELNKLQHAPLQSPDYTVQLNYLNELLALPWNEYTPDNLSTKNAQKILDRDHYGMKKIKDRIVEQIAVMNLKNDMKAPILCLVGPPGTGKTSLGKSIAEALGRKYVRVALGGLHDESEVRGHRRTYIGAMPGRIIKGIRRAGSSNPVFILDEIDKIQSQTHNGDPTAAMLEVLDPEQNSAFHDNYLDVDFDLSKVMFIATANSLSTIQPALIDRMEVIDIDGYILEEKIEIAKRHLVPRQLQEHGFEKKALTFGKAVLTSIINDYTRESGVRQLDKTLAKVVRSRAVLKAQGLEYDKEISVSELQSILGLPIHNSEKMGKESRVGVVTGLAWTSVGGEVLFVECSTNKGKGQLTMTGNLGDVMKESATLAHEYIKANAERLGISQEVLDNTNMHIHVPEGATPKDGPSAGITMFVAMVSALTQKRVRNDWAMTGEATLRGQVTPVGGIREKILAAKRAGIKHLLLCEDNRRDIEDIDKKYLAGLTFHFINEMSEALPLVLEK
ncbi:MAG: endopeptidase La [Bacteroidales bacterium]|nr:endopeptidase La [Bacteroidales bacterium]